MHVCVCRRTYIWPQTKLNHSLVLVTDLIKLKLTLFNNYCFFGVNLLCSLGYSRHLVIYAHTKIYVYIKELTIREIIQFNILWQCWGTCNALYVSLTCNAWCEYIFFSIINIINECDAGKYCRDWELNLALILIYAPPNVTSNNVIDLNCPADQLAAAVKRANIV